jgi:hypothetical protein
LLKKTQLSPGTVNRKSDTGDIELLFTFRDEERELHTKSSITDARVQGKKDTTTGTIYDPSALFSVE